MWNRKETSYRLSREILGSFGWAFVIALASFWLLNECANIILLRYVQEEVLIMSEDQLIGWQYRILGFSMLSGVLLFIVLFLLFVGERLAYIKEIVKGIDALGCHQWEYEIPLKGKNELTELAKRINTLSKEEQMFQEKEKQLQEEKVNLIRSLSHDIRTPLTSLMSYSEFLKQKENLSTEEVKAFMDLVEQKSQQIKVLTDRLLDNGSRSLEVIENGKFFLEQLVDEWAAVLEDDFTLEVSFEACPEFSGEFDVQELRRVFDNLASNIQKYADKNAPVVLQIHKKEDGICILQSNVCKELLDPVESTKIGIDSIKKVVANHGGNVEVVKNKNSDSMEIFRISLELPCKFL